MNIRLNQLIVSTRRTTEKILFSESVTFLYGPVGTGKSTVARLIDYCFGGDLERTPAIQQEFVSVILNAKLGDYDCTFERSTKDKQSVRVTWALGENDYGSVNAPLIASQAPLLNAEVYTLSDLMFHLCGVEPIKVHKRSQDQNSQMIRLGFRDIWLFCYLDQAHLDSSFFRMEDPFRGRKSQDAMRFFTGLHSERLSKLQEELCRTETEQQGAREAVSQIRHFMKQFNFESQNEIITQIEESKRKLLSANNQIQTIEKTREIILHPDRKSVV